MADDGNDAPTGRERRSYERFDTTLSVDWASGDSFLFSYITNISEMGIFIRSEDPPRIGTSIRVRFALENEEPLELSGTVVWINPMRADGENLNPGMGVRFDDLSPEQRERVVDIVRTVAYLQDDATD